jgi:hypothetical protein
MMDKTVDTLETIETNETIETIEIDNMSTRPVKTEENDDNIEESFFDKKEIDKTKLLSEYNFEGIIQRYKSRRK